MTQLTKAILALMTDYKDGFANFAPEVNVLEKIDALEVKQNCLIAIFLSCTVIYYHDIWSLKPLFYEINYIKTLQGNGMTSEIVATKKLHH